LDAVLAHVDRIVTECPRHERRYSDVGAIAFGGLHREARHRQLADVEIHAAERTEEDFLGWQVHEHGTDAVDLHRAVHERTHPVVVADRDGELKFRHRPRSFCGLSLSPVSCPAKAGHPVSSAVRNCEKQVVPIGVCFFNQPNFPGSIPLLEPLFTKDRAFDIAELFEVNQAMDAVSFGEAAHHLRSMLEYPPNKIVCDPDIERATNLTGEDVHPKNFLFAHRRYAITGSPACAGDDGRHPSFPTSASSNPQHLLPSLSFQVA